MATEIFRQRRRLSVFLSPEKEKLEKKELQGGCPLDPRCGCRHHHRMRKQWVGWGTGRTMRTGLSSPFKRPAANKSRAAGPPECAFLHRFRVSGFCLRSFAQAKNAGNSGDAVGNPLYTDVKYPVKIHPVFRITLQYTTECAPVTRAFRDFFVRYCLILPRGRQFPLKNSYRTGS